jgi:hypothetical protein
MSWVLDFLTLSHSVKRSDVLVMTMNQLNDRDLQMNKKSIESLKGESSKGLI